MNVYLSIDLDYWNGQRSRGINRFFSRVFDLRLPIFVVPSHDQLLEHINSHPECDCLINVDYHSDVVDRVESKSQRNELTEGSWVSFVRWRNRASYVWRYPDEMCRSHNEGYCHLDAPGKNPFENPRVSGWREAREIRGVRGLPWDSVIAVGVSLSPIWLFKSPVARVVGGLGITRWRGLDFLERAKALSFFSLPTWSRPGRAMSYNPGAWTRLS